jgi:hypothetical protein
VSKIVVLVEPMTVEQDRSFANYLESKGWGYWHWLANSWLIDAYGASDDEAAVLVEIRDALQKAAPGKTCLAFKVDVGQYYAGFGPQASSGNSMFAWIDNTWVK